jgi:Phage integrase family.
VASLGKCRRFSQRLVSTRGGCWGTSAQPDRLADDAGTPVHIRRHYLPDSVTRAFERAVTKSGLPRVNFHTLCHGHASYLAAAGTPPNIISERLGHSTAAFTMTFYVHASPVNRPARPSLPST